MERIRLAWCHGLTVFYSTHSVQSNITASVGEDLLDVVRCLQQEGALCYLGTSQSKMTDSEARLFIKQAKY